MTEFHALLELLGMLIADPRTGVLLVLLALAGWHDSRSFRIPNWLTSSGLLYALALNVFVPLYPHAPWWLAAAGMLTGFAVLLPLWLLRIMGAGDVKLMAMVGAFLGFPQVLQALLFSLIAAGLGALLLAAARGVLPRMLANVGQLMRGMLWSAVAAGRPAIASVPMVSVGRLPLGVAIAAGTGAWLVADQLGFL